MTKSKRARLREAYHWLRASLAMGANGAKGLSDLLRQFEGCVWREAGDDLLRSGPTGNVLVMRPSNDGKSFSAFILYPTGYKRHLMSKGSL